jgi:hypothetical protein
MCRLLGYCTRDAASVAEVLGERGLGEFTRLSAYHCHGWGMAWYRDAAALIEKSSTGWPQDGWTLLPNRHVLVVDRATLRCTVRRLAPRPSRQPEAVTIDPGETSGCLSSTP